MPSLNRVQLIGRLGKDPETRFTPTGKKVCSYTLAVDHRWKNASGEAKNSTEWFNLETWGRLGEISQQYLHKGNLVYVEGRLKTDRYEHEGETRFFTKVIISGMQMLERRTEEEEPVVPDEEDAPE